jgi:UDP-glucose 4-epimerase
MAENLIASPPAPQATANTTPRCYFVTGATGYLGGQVVQQLLQMPGVREVRAGIRSDQSGALLRAHWPGEDRLIPVVGELPQAPWPLEGVDILIHAAAWISARSSLAGDEFFLVNAEGTRKLAAAARQAGVKRMVYCSTQAVYGTRQPTPWPEDQAPHPETSYALSKWMGEEFCRYPLGRSIPTIILRLSRIYGLGHFMRWNDFSHKFPALAAQGCPLPIQGNGAESLDCLHEQDFRRALLGICDLPLASDQALTLNLGSGKPQTVAAYAELCLETAKRLGFAGSQMEFLPSPASRIRHFELDITRASKLLHWQPQTLIETAVAELILAAKPRSVQKPNAYQSPGGA